MVTISFQFEIADDDKEALALALGCSVNQISQSLNAHGKAALSEYVEAYCGRRDFNRGSDILEHRLALLIREVFIDRLPSESEVGLLFQTAPYASRTLLRNTLSKYRYMLRDQSAASAKALLESATWSADGDAVHIKIVSSTLLELLNDRLRTADATKKALTRLSESVATYETTESAYKLLCKEFGATRVTKP
jgi:hypothetical protein